MYLVTNPSTKPVPITDKALSVAEMSPSLMALSSSYFCLKYSSSGISPFILSSSSSPFFASAEASCLVVSSSYLPPEDVKPNCEAIRVDTAASDNPIALPAPDVPTASAIFGACSAKVLTENEPVVPSLNASLYVLFVSKYLSTFSLLSAIAPLDSSTSVAPWASRVSDPITSPTVSFTNPAIILPLAPIFVTADLKSA